MLEERKIKAGGIREVSGGDLHITVVTKDTDYGYHHNLVVISKKERDDNELKSKPKQAMATMIKIKSKKLHDTWVASRIKALKGKGDFSDLVDDFDLGT